MKKTLLGVILIILILIPALLIAPSFFDWNSYKPQIKEQVEAYTGLDLDIAGDVKLAILPTPYAYASGVTVRNSEHGSTDPFLQLERLDLVLQVGPLLSGKVALSSVELVKPIINLNQNADGIWNWQTDKIDALMNKEEEAVDTDAPKQSNFDLSLENVEIQDGDITLTQSGKSPTVLKDIDLVISADSLSGPFNLKGDAEFQGNEVFFDVNSGRLTPDSKAFPINAEITAPGYGANIVYSGVFEPGENYMLQGQTKVTVRDLGKVVGDVEGWPQKPLQTSGLLTVTPNSAEYKNLAVTYGDNAFDGALSLSDNYSVAKIDVKSNRFTLYPQISSVAVNGIFAISENLYQARSLSAKIDDTTITGEVSYVPGTRGLLKANINLGALDLNKFTASTGQTKKMTKNDVIAMMKPLLLPFDAQLQVKAASLKQGDVSYRDVSFAGNLKGENLHIDNLQVGDFKNAVITASGDIADLEKATGINAKLSLSSQDFSQLAEMAKFDMSTLPAGVKGGTLAVQYNGSLDSGNATVNVGAMNGQVIASGDVNDPVGTLGFNNLVVQVKHPNFEQLVQALAGQGTGFTSLNKPLDFYAKIDKGSDSASLSDMKATIGSVPMSGELSVTDLLSKPSLKGDIQFGKVVLTTAANNKSRASTGWSNEPIKTDAFHTFNMDVNVAAESLQYNEWNMSAPKVHLTLNDGVFGFKDFNAGMYQGQLFLDANLNAPKTGPITIDAKTQIREVSLEPLVQSFTGGKILQGQGRVNVDADVNSSGVSPAALVNNLKGSGLTNGQDIILEGFDLKRFGRAMSSETKPGDTALGLWKTATKGGTTQFDTMDGEFNIQNGIVNLTKLNLEGPEALLGMTGTVDLKKWYLDSQCRIEIKENDGATPPFTIKIAGPLDNPGSTLGQGILEDYLSRKINRKLQDVIQDKLGDKLFGGMNKQQPQQAPTNSGADGASGAANDGSTAAQDGAAPEQPVQQKQEPAVDPREEAIKGLINGLLK